MQHRLIALALLAGLASARVAAACSDNEVDTTRMISPGILLGVAGSEPSHSDFILGGELSVFRLKDHEPCGHGAPMAFSFPTMSWVGGYLDADFDFSTHAIRTTLGPEAGTQLVGIDGGLAIEQAADRVHVGFAIRPVLTFGYVQWFVRWEDLTGVGNQFEGGLLIKRPTELVRRR